MRNLFDALKAQSVTVEVEALKMRNHLRFLKARPSLLSHSARTRITRFKRRNAVGELTVQTNSGECCATCLQALNEAFEMAVQVKAGTVIVHETVSSLNASASNGCTVCQILIKAIAYSEMKDLDLEDPVAICLELNRTFSSDVLCIWVGYESIDVPIYSRTSGDGDAQRSAFLSSGSSAPSEWAPSEWMPSSAASSIREQPDHMDSQDTEFERRSRSISIAAPSSSSEFVQENPEYSIQTDEEDQQVLERIITASETMSGNAGAEDSAGMVEHAEITSIPDQPQRDAQKCGMGKTNQDDPRPVIYDPRQKSGDLASLAKQWLGDCSCVVSHGSNPTPPQQSSPLPTRVIDVGHFDGSVEHQAMGLKLYESLPGECGDYVTLSYCWGSVPNTGRTTADMLAKFRQRIPWDMLPLTIQDAVVFVRQVGVRYLWVDALCIIQADVVGGHSPDFEREAVRLGDYYGGSVFTIAAASASNSSQGLFTKRMGANFNPSPCTIHTTNTLKEWQKEMQLQAPIPEYKADIMDSILLGRGWVTQEIEFSTRILFFGRNCLAWRCRTGWRFENGSTRETNLERKAQGCPHCEDIYEVGIGELTQLLLNPYEHDDVYDHDHGHVHGLRWLKFVEEYSKTHFTQPRDRLIALSSLTNRMKADGSHEFVGGIWKDSLLQGLTWFLSTDSVEPEKSRGHAPSWSWASVSSPVHFLPEVSMSKVHASIQGVVPMSTRLYMPGGNVILHMRAFVGELNLLKHSVRRWGVFEKWKPIGATSLTHARCWRSKIVDQPFFRNVKYHGPWSPGMLVLDQARPRNRLLGDLPRPFVCAVLYTHQNYSATKTVRRAVPREDAICLLLEKIKPQEEIRRGTTLKNGLDFYRRIGVVELQDFRAKDLVDAMERDFCLV